MRDFKHFSKETINEPHLNIWTIKTSPESMKNKKQEELIEHISNEGIEDLTPFVDKKYKLVALQVNIQKSIYIYSLGEWMFYEK